MMVIAGGSARRHENLLARTPDEHKTIDNRALAKIKADIPALPRLESRVYTRGSRCAVPGLVDEGMLPRIRRC